MNVNIRKGDNSIFFLELLMTEELLLLVDHMIIFVE